MNVIAASLPSFDDINTMKKDELKSTLTKLVKQIKELKCTSNDHDSSGLVTILQEMRSETMDLKKQMVEMQKKMVSPDLSHALNPTPAEASGPMNQSLAEVVRETVKSAIDDEQAKSQLILSRISEDANAQQIVNELCDQINFSPKPTGMMRIGRKSPGRQRLLRVSFPSQFDARKFKSSFDAMKKDNADSSNIRVRFNRTKEECKRWQKSSDIAYKLNKEAKDAGAAYSFSVRENGDVWKFTKSDDGKWRRVKEWKPPHDESANSSGNSR